jgi:hypothetical protein
MEYTTMVLPSSLLEEEDELLSVGTLNHPPLTRAPCATLYSGGQGYNGHLRPETPTTLQIGHDDDGRHP